MCVTERKIQAAGKEEAALQVTGELGCTHFPPVSLPWAKHTGFRQRAAQRASRYSQESRETDLQEVSFLGIQQAISVLQELFAGQLPGTQTLETHVCQ